MQSSDQDERDFKEWNDARSAQLWKQHEERMRLINAPVVVHQSDEPVEQKVFMSIPLHQSDEPIEQKAFVSIPLYRADET